VSEKIRVLRIHNRLHLGGPIFNVTYLTKYLPADIYETKLLIGPHLPDEVSADFFLKNEGVPYTMIEEMRRSPNPLKDLKAFFKIRKIIKEFRPHIVHTHTAKAGTLGRLAAWSCGVPVTFHTFHGHVFHSYFSAPVNFAIRQFERMLAKFTSKIITISEQQKKEIFSDFRIVSPDKCPVVPLGFDLDKFGKERELRREIFRGKFNLMDEDLAVGIIGRFAPIKNHMLLFEALALVKENHPSLFERLVIFCIGDGDLKTDFQQFLRKKSIPFSGPERTFTGGGIVFTSWIRQVETVLPGLDLVALTSDNEGTPLSLIESQAAGVPVISTKVGGVEDVVNENETGWLTPKGDIDALAKGLIKALENKHDLPEMGKKGRAWVNQKFSYQRLVWDIDRLYRWNLQKRNIAVPQKTEILKNDPTVSVITVCKNRKQLIAKAIESIELQNYPQIEYIIIDGGSIDGTYELISNHPRVNKFVSEPDNGIYDAMNKGLKMASGDIIAFLNSDDSYVSNDVISNIIRIFQEKNADAVYGDIIYIDEDESNVKRYWKAGKYRINSFKWGWMPPHPAFFVKKEVVDKHGDFIESLSLSADYELMLRFIHYHGIFIEYLPKVLVSMRLGGASNHNISNRLMANKQDKLAWQMNSIKPNLLTTWLKPIRKLPQWLFPKWRMGKMKMHKNHFSQ
jgi:glycosyltransferase involved in cell wall biosynthesis